MIGLNIKNNVNGKVVNNSATMVSKIKGAVTTKWNRLEQLQYDDVENDKMVYFSLVKKRNRS